MQNELIKACIPENAGTGPYIPSFIFYLWRVRIGGLFGNPHPKAQIASHS